MTCTCQRWYQQLICRYRPWEMVLVVYGFATKASALDYFANDVIAICHLLEERPQSPCAGASTAV